MGKSGFQPVHAVSAPTSEEIRLLDAMYLAGQFSELEAFARSLLKLYRESGVVWKLYGLSLQMLGKEALPALRRAAELLPSDAEAHGNLAAALRAHGQLDAAVASGKRAVQIGPDSPEAHNNLGVALQASGQLDEAVESYIRALQIKPDFYEVYNNLGTASKELGLIEDAVGCYRSVLGIKPDFAEAHNNLGLVLKDLGQFDGALDSFRKALAIRPDYVEAYNNLLFTLNYTPQPTESCLDEARKFGRMVTHRVTGRYTSWPRVSRSSRLRIGMVSGDLRNHPVGYFLESFLASLNPHCIELIAYPTTARADELTARIKPFFAAWHPIANLDDRTAAQLIHGDGVHVLIDLSGHTGNGRLPLFAWKPAPVQVTWLGYPASTGVAEMDYILGDRWALPSGEEHHFVEKCWRLPDVIGCLAQPREQVAVSELPALRNHSITFGTLNNLAKMNDRVVACWARILTGLPDSQLYLNMVSLKDEAFRQQVVERYASHGIPATRLILESTAGRIAALSSYNRIDIALDPFPYPGITTSYEALWMGVPILTMRGNNYMSHWGESILQNAGLSDWIAENEDEYVAKAISMSAQVDGLAELREGLRSRVMGSPLFDATRFARSFESAMQGMWQEYILSISPSLTPAKQ